MSTHFRLKRSKFSKKRKAQQPFDDIDWTGIEPVMPAGAEYALPDKLWTWLAKRVRSEGASLRKRRPGIDMLEPRLLMSGDPVTASAALAAGTENAALRITEVKVGDNQTEQQLQLIEGTNAEASDATVISKWKVAYDGDTKRVVDASTGGFVDTLSIAGNNSNNSLLLDSSILGLAEGMCFDVSLGTGIDTIVGADSGEGLVWSLNTIDSAGAEGTLSILKPTGSATNPDTDTAQSDLAIDNKETYAAGRDNLLSFSGVEKLDLQAARDIVSDQTAGAASEWGLTWSSDANDIVTTTLNKFTTATDVGSAASTATGRDTSFSITGADGLVASSTSAHLNLGFQTRTATQAGATLNAGSGTVSLYEATDTSRENPFGFDVRGVTGYTGTEGDDQARAASGISMNLLGGVDSLAGSDDDYVAWTLKSRSAGDDPEAKLALSFYDESKSDWRIDRARHWDLFWR